MPSWYEGISRWVQDGFSSNVTRPVAPAEGGREDMQVAFRLTAWPDLPPPMQNVRVYRLLSFMSTRAVTARWLRLRSGLPPNDTDRLMEYLRDEQALQVIEVPRSPSPHRRRPIPPRR